MRKNIFKYSIWSVILLMLLFICMNVTTRNIFSRLIDIHSLKTKIEDAEKRNLDLKKRLEYLKTKPALMDKYVKQDLKLLAEDEIEYHFNDYKTEEEDKQ
ncbi:MAG: septum formation initiator family protein [Endomicrobiaceae bacterium]|nr:septum formation initiator family protein [Endomicrobiaceae bacterium]